MVVDARPLGFPWETVDPFLFCVHHDDAYPAGTDALGPATSLKGRNLGQDFAGKDGWRMYHGAVVPGFPPHPHRGFETVTVVRRGFIDHSDSLGATARFGRGDTQWLTAGAGIVHSEMFPLLEREAPNPLELFQIWLNLPAADKLVAPHFSMLWSEDIPRTKELTLIAGRLADLTAPPPPPHSWAARPEHDVVIATIRLQAGASWTLPKALSPKAVRTLFFFSGSSLRVGDHLQSTHASLRVATDADLRLEAGDSECQLLLLQGVPIGEPVAHYGPFVMNTEDELRRAFADYQRTRFGGWPFGEEPVHPRDAGRFAKHADGRIERRET